MVKVKYGELPRENICKYFELLINKTYKILPLKEENSETLQSYIESYLVELIGNKYLISILADEPKYLTMIGTLEYLSSQEYTTSICKKEVFKCIKIINDIKHKYFEGGDSYR